MRIPGGDCRKPARTFICAFAAILFGGASILFSAAVPTVFTYQGNLKESGQSANGIYDLIFSLYDSLSNGTQICNAFTNSATGVTNGLFSVSLDFGASGFIPKRFGVETLHDAIMKVMDGDVWVPPDTDLSREKSRCCRGDVGRGLSPGRAPS